MLPITGKQDYETHWSARSEVVKVIYAGLDDIVELLGELSEDAMTPGTINDANQLEASGIDLNFIVLLYFWNAILGKIDGRILL